MTDYLTLSPTNPALIGLVVAFVGGLAAWAFTTGRIFTGGGAAKFRRSVSLAVKSLWLHKLRSFLSVLGIIIGTSAVISLMAFGEGSMQDALADIKRQGATNIIVRSVKPPDDSATANRGFVTTYGLTKKDLDKFTTFGDVITRMVPLRVFPTDAEETDDGYTPPDGQFVSPRFSEDGKSVLATSPDGTIVRASTTCTFCRGAPQSMQNR